MRCVIWRRKLKHFDIGRLLMGHFDQQHSMDETLCWVLW